MQLTFQQAKDKIIQAYYKDEIQPYNGKFCFCGTLNNNNSNWNRENSLIMRKDQPYLGHEFSKMEYALLEPIRRETFGGRDIYFQTLSNDTPKKDREEVKNHPNYENALFEGMCNALDVLEEIHKERGENTEYIPTFVKRELIPAAHLY